MIAWPSICMVAAALSSTGASPGGFELAWSTLSGGGGTSVGAGFALSGTVGQHDAGEASGDGFTLSGGFWIGVTGIKSPPCPADLNADRSIDGADLGLLLGAWGDSGPGDLTGDGNVDGADLGLLLGAWGACP